MFSEFGKFLLEGGVPVYAMLLLACFAAAVCIERVKALFFRYSIKADVFMNQVKNLIVGDKIEEAIALCTAQKEPLLPKVIKAILERADRDDESIKNVQEVATMEIIPLATKGLGYLSMIANVATLIGLLGTIHGLIQSFQAISFADPAQKQTLLAQGISLSMNTTALGLLVAIPVMVVYAFLHAKQSKIIDEIMAHGTKVVDLLISRNYQGYDEEVAYTSRNELTTTQKTAPPPPANKRKAA